MTTLQIAAAAREYRSCPDRREEILLRLHAAGGGPAVEALGRAAGVDPEALLRWLEERYRQRRRWRRRRAPVCVDPPPGPGEVDPAEAAEVAAEACGAQVRVWLPGPEGNFRRGKCGAANFPELARAWDGLKGGGK